MRDSLLGVRREKREKEGGRSDEKTREEKLERAAEIFLVFTSQISARN